MSRPKTTHTQKHLQIDVGQRTFDRLQRLKEVTEAGRYADVITNALRIYDSVVTDVLNGYQVIARKGDDEVRYKVLI